MHYYTLKSIHVQKRSPASTVSRVYSSQHRDEKNQGGGEHLDQKRDVRHVMNRK